MKIGAFCTHDEVHLDGAPNGPLAGLKFAAKDIFDIKGRTCCCGNPDWLATHSPAECTAPAVQCLLDAGATLVGMTITEELVMGLTGENPHYGAPVNSVAPDRVTGGSSSGSASAVAAGVVDFALGSDTGGSVRVPASFCGIYGIRPTHGRVSLDGVMEFAPSLDTVGWFARDAAMLERVGRVILASPAAPLHQPTSLLMATDAFDVIDADLRDALAPAVDEVSSLLGGRQDVRMAGDDDLESWSKLIAVYREYEGWQSHRDWIERDHPGLSEQGAMRMKSGAKITRDDMTQADKARAAVRARLRDLLAGGLVLAVPPLRGKGLDAAWQLVARNGRINGAAALAGLPQISLPLARVDGVPVGLGLIADAGGDEMLLAVAKKLAS